MSQIVTVELPDSLYDRLVRTAELLDKSTDQVIADSLGHALPPILDEIPTEYCADVLPLVGMGEAELRRESSHVFPTRAWREYESLLEKRRLQALTSQEAERLDALRRKGDVLTLRRSYAAVLLKRRGDN